MLNYQRLLPAFLTIAICLNPLLADQDETDAKQDEGWSLPYQIGTAVATLGAMVFASKWVLEKWLYRQKKLLQERRAQTMGGHGEQFNNALPHYDFTHAQAIGGSSELMYSVELPPEKRGHVAGRLKENLALVTQDKVVVLALPTETDGQKARSTDHLSILKSLIHSNINPILETSTPTPGAPIFVVTAPAPQLLRDVLSQERSPEQLNRMIQGLLAAVGYMHDNGVFHMNLNPDTIIITAEGDALITGFEHARRLPPRTESRLRASIIRREKPTLMLQMAFGRAPYLAPEVLATLASNESGHTAERYDATRVDAYQLGYLIATFILGEDVIATSSEEFDKIMAEGDFKKAQEWRQQLITNRILEHASHPHYELAIKLMNTRPKISEKEHKKRTRKNADRRLPFDRL